MPVIRMVMIRVPGVVMIVSAMRGLMFVVHRMECPLVLERPASEQYRKALVSSAQPLCDAAYSPITGPNHSMRDGPPGEGLGPSDKAVRLPL
jgi:hypothetical protein